MCLRVVLATRLLEGAARHVSRDNASERFDLPTRTVDYDPFIEDELAFTNQL